MSEHKLHRVMILNRENQLYVGSLTYRDICLFVIRNLRAETDSFFKTPLSDIKHKIGK
jgi:hypothetical protein